MISPGSIDLLLNAAVVEDVVGDYVTLRRSGSRFKGLCPFHDEKTPSFTVTPTLGIYKCFGCQKGGNSIHFLMEMENLSFAEAARQLARRYGVELEETGGQETDEYKENQKLRESLQAVLDYAAGFFSTQLHDTENGRNIALAYFKERGFTTDTIHKWGLGYSPDDWEALTKQAQKDGYSLDYLEQAGLVKKRENGSPFDLFRNRVMFRLQSVSGKIIGFAGRKMSSTDPSPKYVNSPETELYKKSDNLFGIFQAKQAIKKSDKVYLTEGYTDVITLHQAGIENVVASSGTALTPGQIKLLRRFSPNVTVLYDGDLAGIKASLRGINLLLAEDLNVRVVSLPEGEDPDSLCAKMGGEAFKTFLQEKEENFILFKAKLLLKDVENDPLKKSDAVRDILDSVAEIRDPLKRTALNRQLAGVCDMEEALLSAELSKLVRKKTADVEQQTYTELKQITEAAGIEMPRETLTDEPQENAFLRLLMLHADKPFKEELTVFDFIMQELHNNDLLTFSIPFTQKVMNEIIRDDIATWPGQQHFVNHSDAEIASWAASVLSSGLELSKAFEDVHIYVLHEEDNYKHEVISLFLHLRRKKLDMIIRENMEKLKNPEAETVDILEYLEYLSFMRLKIANELGGAVFTM
ncbi:MAG: DNA primase [Bacteroidetes bacterium]|nr:DNA primase [Bacteroidota bacterium]